MLSYVRMDKEKDSGQLAGDGYGCVFLDFIAGFICRGLQRIQVAGAKTWIGQGSFLHWFFMGSGWSLWPCLDLKKSEATVLTCRCDHLQKL